MRVDRAIRADCIVILIRTLSSTLPLCPAMHCRAIATIESTHSSLTAASENKPSATERHTKPSVPPPPDHCVSLLASSYRRSEQLPDRRCCDARPSCCHSSRHDLIPETSRADLPWCRDLRTSTASQVHELTERLAIALRDVCHRPHGRSRELDARFFVLHVQDRRLDELELGDYALDRLPRWRRGRLSRDGARRRYRGARWACSGRMAC